MQNAMVVGGNGPWGKNEKGERKRRKIRNFIRRKERNLKNAGGGGRSKCTIYTPKMSIKIISDH